MNSIKIALVGCGYWGPNYIRVFNNILKCKLSYCCDLDMAKLEKIKQLYPWVKIFKDYKDIKSTDIDAVVIATPLNTHYEIAKYFFNNNKHILIEKPLTSTSGEAEDLIKIAKKNKLVLMVGHVYEYNSGIRALKEIIQNGRLGKIYYLKAERMGLGPIRKHASALWDLATHDISILLYLFDRSPIKIFAQGWYYIQDNIEDFVDLNLIFPNNIFCNIYASWFAPEKVRKLIVIGSKAMVVFDDVNKSEILKIYEREIREDLLDSTPNYSDHQNIVNIGDIFIPKIQQLEPLAVQVEEFINSINEKREPLSDGENGLRVIKILEDAQKYLRQAI